MNLAQYAAQQQLLPQPPQNAETMTNQQLPESLDSERLSSLMADAEAALEEQQAPDAILTRIFSDLFGEDSKQAETLARIQSGAAAPGGYDLAIAQTRQQRQLLKKQSKQLTELQKQIAETITALDEKERSLSRDKIGAAALDSALTDAAAFALQIKQAAPAEIIKRADALYNQHRRSLPAMGLLYGLLTETAAENAAAGSFDLFQLEELNRLRREILKALQEQ